jgi:hypothetical protein
MRAQCSSKRKRLGTLQDHTNKITKCSDDRAQHKAIANVIRRDSNKHNATTARTNTLLTHYI